MTHQTPINVQVEQVGDEYYGYYEEGRGEDIRGVSTSAHDTPAEVLESLSAHVADMRREQMAADGGDQGLQALFDADSVKEEQELDPEPNRSIPINKGTQRWEVASLLVNGVHTFYTSRAVADRISLNVRQASKVLSYLQSASWVVREVDHQYKNSDVYRYRATNYLHNEIKE